MPPPDQPSHVRPRPTHAAHRRPSSRVVMRRRRTVAVGLLAVVIVIIVVLVAGSGSGTKPVSAPPKPVVAHGHVIAAVEAGVLPWSLGSPLSRQVVLPGPGQSLTVLGGLSASNSSLDTVFSLDTTSGQVADLGTLPAGVHDAAGVRLGATDLVLGGGSPATVAATEAVTAPTASGHVSATVAGRLPQPRSDASAVAIGSTAYVVGGYDGTNPDPQVLATTDGVHFSVVATLSEAVRYPAVVAVGTRIYVFGGEAVGGTHAGDPVDAVQVVDVTARRATMAKPLPTPLMGAAAAVVGGQVYIAGGATVPAPAGASGPPAGDAVWAYDLATGSTLRAGTLRQPVAFGGAQVVGNRVWLVGGEDNGTPVSTVQMFTPNAAFGQAGAAGAGSPFFGDRLLVADRGNDRLLVLDDTDTVVWSYPSATKPAPPGGFYFPDDAFFANHGSQIISNQEENETIVILGYPSGALVWSYGHPHQTGSSPGYLHEPDDAYLLKNGQITVADAQNCRILFINRDTTIAGQIGTTGVCQHQPPNAVASPNGDTPLADGNVLVSEVNGSWVSEYTPKGALVWTVHLAVHYPSDPQQLGPDLYLIADYAHPGAIVEFNREGQILYRYQPTSGPGVLNQPSLVEMLPSGVFMTNDDYRNRMLAIDPATQATVWQYGVTDTAGTAPGSLNIPDGFDLLLPDGSTPTHKVTS